MIFWSAVASIALALAVMLGAFGAHALRGRLDADAMAVYHTAVLYHVLHALGLLIVSILPRAGMLPAPIASWVSILLLLGIILFSGSLYLLAGTGFRPFGAITPIGGLCFIAAWLLLGWGVVASR